MTDLAETKHLLKDLVGFPSISGKPNKDIIEYISKYLARYNVKTSIDAHLDGKRFNLLATFGPEKDGGVALSSHLDVVPANPKLWFSDPFILREKENRLIGRGALDMKGFLACTLAMTKKYKAIEEKLNKPIQFALTFDEEVCSFGAAQFGKFFDRLGFLPKIAIIGEPTGMEPYIGHKAIIELTTEITGSTGHASNTRGKVNAIYVASKMITKIEEIAKTCSQKPEKNSSFEPPYTTFNVGEVNGGEARNIVPNFCNFLWEIRPIPSDDGQSLLKLVIDWVEGSLLPDLQSIDPQANVKTTVLADVPGMEARPHSAAMRLIQRLWTNSTPRVVSFGTDGGYFQKYGIETIIFGPGQMSQMHQPEEYISEFEIEDCLKFLTNLGEFMISDEKF